MTGNYTREMRKRLACGCLKHFPSPGPGNGSMVWCHYHQKMSEVMFTDDMQWRFKCTKCTYRKKHGKNQLLCMMEAARHLRRNPAHVVEVFNPDGEVVKTFGPKEQGQLELPPMTDDEVPF